MRRPSFQFYPADWSANSNLRRCTHEEKGIWIDFMCLLHDQEEYGVARWSLKEIAQAIGCTPAKLRGLVTKGVIKGCDTGAESEALVYVPRSGRKDGPPVTLIASQDGPIWFSSRMVIDEYKRVLRGEWGATPKATPDHSPKGGIGATPKATPDHSPFTCAPGQAPRAAPSSSSSVNPQGKQSPSHPEPESREKTAELAAAIPDPPTTEGHWLTWFNREARTNFDPGSRFDRDGLWPIFRRWCDVGISQQQMRDAVHRAFETATEPIANLPKYVDRVLASSQAPPRLSHSDASKLAAARAIFGTEIEGENHGSSERIIDAAPVARLVGC